MPGAAMNQVYFVVILYLMGLLFGLQFRKHIPMPFFCLSSFFWGSLFYIFMAIIFIGFGLPFSLPAMGGITALTAAFLSGLAIKRKQFNLSRSDFYWCASSGIVFTLAAVFFAHFNYSQITTDSIEAILRGRALAYDGLTRYTIGGFSVRGTILPVVQSAGVLIHEGYLAIYQPLLSLSFIATFIFMAYRAIKWVNKWLKLAFVSLTALSLFSTTILFYQIFYIHTNFFTAAYLFIGLVAFWLAGVENNKTWLIFSAIGMAGFSLSRLESPIMFVVFSLFMLGVRQLTYRERLAVYLPGCVGLIAWHVKVAEVMQVVGSSDTNPAQLWVIVAGLASLVILVLISKIEFIEKFLLPVLPVFTILALAIIIPVFYLLNSHLMETSLQSIYSNLTTSGEWNAAWFGLLGLLIIGTFQKKLPFDVLFTNSFIAFFLLLVDLAFFLGSPYRPSPFGSANRMLTHIIPLITFYLIVKFSQGFLPGIDSKALPCGFRRKGDLLQWLRRLKPNQK
jgi:hypothetical protein